MTGFTALQGLGELHGRATRRINRWRDKVNDEKGRRRALSSVPNGTQTAIVMVDGGLGSTMMKYAIGKCIEQETDLHVLYDLGWFERWGLDVDGIRARKFELLNVFPHLDYDIASPEQCELFRRYYTITNDRSGFNSRLLHLSGPTYVDGYWGCWQYLDRVEDQLRRDFNFASLPLDQENANYLAEIRAQETSVAVQVRRGDYANLGWCILQPSYFIRAINHVKEQSPSRRPHFFFFSDDQSWVAQNIIPVLPKDVAFTLVEANDNDTGCMDLFLISQCDHQIASNSSFGVWGGFLNANPNKIVVVPAQWLPTGAGSPYKFPKWASLPIN